MNISSQYWHGNAVSEEAAVAVSQGSPVASVFFSSSGFARFAGGWDIHSSMDDSALLSAGWRNKDYMKGCYVTNNFTPLDKSKYSVSHDGCVEVPSSDSRV